MVALQLGGAPAATLGEVKNRADLVIFWGSNPAESHPRHFTRYSGAAKGRMNPKGRKDRYIVLVDIRPTPSAKYADEFIQIKPGHDFEVLTVMRMLASGKLPDARSVGGVEVQTLERLVSRCKDARMGVLFFGQGITETRGKHQNSLVIYQFGKEMSLYSKFLTLPMRGHYNVVGSGNTMCWQTGYPFAVNFGRGYPQFNPGEFSVVDLLKRKEPDAALIVAAEPMDHLPYEAARHLENIPTIVLDPRETLTTRMATVVIPVKHAGISVEGTAYRMDHIPIKMRAVLDSPWPKDDEPLERIIQRVKELRKEKAAV
ncbi:MAG: formylmethanofuran dehydrogenase subunit B [Nitrospinota bacterium]|nr:formylmethanofuran dehydrogenase subunit B [Nitrospinota bacterium]